MWFELSAKNHLAKLFDFAGLMRSEGKISENSDEIPLLR